jgi:adenosylcobyric acid synthase
MLAARKGIVIAKGEHTNPRAFRETQYNLMAESIRAHLDLDAVYGMLREAAI